MKKKLLMVLIMMFMVTGCGKIGENPVTKATEKKEEIVMADEMENEEDAENSREEIVTEETIEGTPTESAPVEPLKETEKQTETKKTTQKTEAKKNETPVLTVTTPVVSESVATPAPEVKECEHWYQPVEKDTYNYIYEMRWSCNGCGYALYDILEDGTAVNFADMYSHPPCETDRYDEPCVGGGFHSEGYYSGRCYHCHTKIIMRSCSYFYVMAERCLKNPSNFGKYEKVDDGCAYIKSCDCGENLLVSDGLTGEGLMVKKEVCSYCGDVKTYPQ